MQQWQAIYDEVYRQQATSDVDESLNFRVWINSYTEQPFTAQEILDSLNDTVERVRALQPQRVLEIGCGTGLILFRLASDCAEYWGTDISQPALESVQRRLETTERHLTNVRVLQRAADDVADLPAHHFDLIILNEIVQYFPDVEYLVRVLTNAMRVVRPEGFIFLGGLRSYALLNAFHAGVQLYQADAQLTISQLKQRIQWRMEQEKELAIDPDFFFAFRSTLPQINGVRIQLKQGRTHNEFTRFRYNATLRIGQKAAQPSAPAEVSSNRPTWTCERIRDELSNRAPAELYISALVNKRLVQEIALLKLLSTDGELTVGEARASLDQLQASAPSVDPEDVHALGRELGYHVDTFWTNHGDDGLFDVHFIKKGVGGSAESDATYLAKAVKERPWSAYANEPLRDRTTDHLISQLRTFVRNQLPEYMLPSAFRVLEALPLTSNGKVDRKALLARQPERVDGSIDTYVAARTPQEEQLTHIWQEVLHLDRVGIHDNFFQIGGHSLLATRIIARIQATFQVELPLRTIFEVPTIAGLARHIEIAHQHMLKTELRPLQPYPREEYIPLSFAQQRLWFLDQWQSDNAVYHVPVALRLHGRLDVSALQQSLRTVIQRQEALRTTFSSHEGEPVQIIAPILDPPILVINLAELPSHKQVEAQQLVNTEARRPFNLEHGPLLRVCLIRLGSEEHIFLLTMHHIISDGWSIQVFLRELSACYTAFSHGTIPATLPTLPIQYADFALWQRQWLQGEVLETQVRYWKQQLNGIPGVLTLPLDHPRPALQSYRGAWQSTMFSKRLLQNLQELSRREHVTLFILLLAAFQVLLAYYSGQDDIVVGTPIANRRQTELDNLIGFFANTLVLRTKLSGNPSFRELLQRVRETALGAYTHQDIPFEQLVEVLQPERNLSHTPLFQVAFVFQDSSQSQAHFADLDLQGLDIDTGTAKFDLTLSLSESKEGFRGAIEYNCDLFEPETIARMLEHLRVLLEAVAERPATRLSALSLLTPLEQERLLLTWNDTQVTYAQEELLHWLYEIQVRQTPDAIALAFEEHQLTYDELNRRSNQLARYLQALGVVPDTLVGVYIERSLELVVALLGILKSGGAYVPLDPSYPSQRLSFMLLESNPMAVLTQQHLLARLPEHETQVVALDADWRMIAEEKAEDLPVVMSPENLAYVIYTSGSTGRPKGVMNTHRGICNRLLWMQAAYQLRADDRVVQKTPYSFDVSVWEFFWPLRTGARLVIARPEGHRDSAYLAHLIQEQQVTIIHFVPSMLSLFLEEPELERCDSLKRVICSGEALSLEVQDRFFARITAELHNLYGPTEAAVDVTAWPCERSGQQRSVPIGRPISNIYLYILDSYLRPVPVGVAGELYIGGIGLARGYYQRPDLTAERFVPDPFVGTRFIASGAPAESGARLYRSGDMVRYLPNGAIEYLGRLDHQVKLRGFRIELGEIETILNEHPAVQEAVVLARWQNL
ncbi:MAG TPA: amino acid adenylation domain-containing protein [Ktedonosporobacter sp.]|nr:amino acid adenylation domain-containing protein [Ktedonosporobacter sp.]